MRKILFALVCLSCLIGCTVKPAIVHDYVLPWPGTGTICLADSSTILHSYTIEQDGLYHVLGSLSLSVPDGPSVWGFFSSTIFVNGEVGSTTLADIRPDASVNLQCIHVANLKKGDVVQLQTYQHSPGDLTCKSVRLCVTRLGE